MGNKKRRKPRLSVKFLRKRIARKANSARAQKLQQGADVSEQLDCAIASETSSVAQTSADIESTETFNLTTPVQFSNDDHDDDGDGVNAQNNNLSIEPELVEDKKSNIGRRIVNVSQFFSQIQDISCHGPLNCGLKSVEIISETRTGLVSQFKLKCNMCNMSFSIHNDNPIDELDLNSGAVAGTVTIGCGYRQFTDLSAAIGLPPMSKKTFSSKMESAHKTWESELLKSMMEAAEEERRLAIEEGRVNSDGIAIIDVIADGCYGKRSYKKNYSSLSGAAAIIGKKTNKILYLAIKNKYCCICAVAQNKNTDVKDHTCYKNYTGPSTGMESEILVEGFKRSLDMHNLIYGRLISDGDANTYSKILQTRPYKNFTVEKVECRNHLLRNMCNKLAALATDTKYLLKYRKCITKKRIMSTRKVIIEAIKKYKNTNNITGLHQDIITAPEHAFGHHGKCKEYFCAKTEDDDTVEQGIFSSSIWQRIKLIISQLAAHARSLIQDVDSNSVERYHSIVAKFIGGKRVNFSQRYQYQMRCNAAALSFNAKNPLTVLHKSIVGRSPDNEIKRNEAKMLKNRLLSQKYLRKKRRLFDKNDSRNYGDDCSKPDMREDMMEESKKIFLKDLERTDVERNRITRETVLQSGNSEWLELRRNLLTASNFGRVIKRRMDVSCQNMVKDILYKKCIDHVNSIKHGKDNEAVALRQLSHQENVKIQPCGLFIDPDVPYLGATPDGLINEDTIVEIKCPKAAHNHGLDIAIAEKKITFYKNTKDGQREINKNHNWFYQIQGQLHVTRRKQCLFGIWLGNDFPVITEVIKRDDHFWSNKMESKLKNFYLDCLLPELIDPRHTRKMSIRDPWYITEAIEQKKAKQRVNSSSCPDQPTTSTAKKRKTAAPSSLRSDSKKRKSC